MVRTRLAKGTQATISLALLDADGEPDTGQTVTVSLSRADGTELLTDDTTTEADGVYSNTLSPTETELIDELRAEWSWGAQSAVSYHDVVGDHYCSLAQLRKTDPLQREGTYTPEMLVAGRDYAAYALERATGGYAWTERYGTRQAEGDGTRTVTLRALGVRELRSLSIDGTAVDVADAELRPGGLLRYAPGFARESLVEVGFVYAGTQAPDPRVARANCLLAAGVLYADALAGAGSGVSPRATSQSTPDGTFSLVTPGVHSADFDIPEVNALVEAYRAWRYA